MASQNLPFLRETQENVNESQLYYSSLFADNDLDYSESRNVFLKKVYS